MPHEIAFDRLGHLYIAERDSHVVRKVEAGTGRLSTVAGTGTAGFSGDGGPAAGAALRQPHSVAIAPDGRLLICDVGNHRLRAVDLAPAPSRRSAAPASAGRRRTARRWPSAPLDGPRAVAVGADGTIYLALREGNAIHRITPQRRDHPPPGRDRDAGLHRRRRAGAPGHARRPEGPRHQRPRPLRRRHREPRDPAHRPGHRRHHHRARHRHARRRPGRRSAALRAGAPARRLRRARRRALRRRQRSAPHPRNSTRETGGGPPMDNGRMDTPRGDHDEDDIRELWDRLADEWQIQVGDEGDANRRLNSDPVLWDLARRRRGPPRARRGLRHGLPDAAARAARRPGHRHRRVLADDRAGARGEPGSSTSASTRAPTLATIDDGAVDAVVANYVVMDMPDLAATMTAFGRVLRPGGIAVLVFSHPCFPQARATVNAPGGRRRLPLAVPVLRAAHLHRPALEALHLALRLLPPAALGLLEGVPRRRLRRRRIRGAADRARPPCAGREPAPARRLPDAPLLGGVQAAEVFGHRA